MTTGQVDAVTGDVSPTELDWTTMGQTQDERVDLLEGIATTRSIRRFRDESIPEEALAQMMFSASRAGSGGNAQPVRFVVLRDGAVATQVKTMLRDALRDMWTDLVEKRRVAAENKAAAEAAGQGHLVPSATVHGPGAPNPMTEAFATVPVVVFACLAFHRGKQTDGANVFPACQNLLLSARALGYGGVLGGFHQLIEPQLRELLGIPDEALMAATIALGKPAGSHGPLRRRPLRELVFEDSWGASAQWAIDPPDARLVG